MLKKKESKYDEFTSELAKNNAQIEEKENKKTAKEAQKLKSLQEKDAIRRAKLKARLKLNENIPENETFKAKVIREFNEGKAITGRKKKQKEFLIKEYQKEVKKKLQEQVKLAEKKLAEAEENAAIQKKNVKGSTSSRNQMYLYSKKIKELEAQLKVEQESKALVEGGLNELNESGLTGNNVEVERNEKETTIKARELKIKEINEELDRLRGLHKRAKNKYYASKAKQKAKKDEDLENVKEKLEAAKLQRDFAKLETPEQRNIRLKIEGKKRKLLAKKRKQRLKLERKKAKLEAQKREFKIAEKEAIISKKVELIRKTQRRQDLILKDKAQAELKAENETAAFRKDSIRNVNKLLVDKLKREKAQKQRIDELIKLEDRARIDAKLSSEALSKDVKNKLLKERERLSGELDKIEMERNAELKKKNRAKIKKKTRTGKGDKASIARDSLKRILNKKSEVEWQKIANKEKELAAKNKAKKQALKQVKQAITDKQKVKEEVTEDEKLKLEKQKYLKEKKRLEETLNAENKKLDTKDKMLDVTYALKMKDLKKKAKLKGIRAKAKKHEKEEKLKSNALNSKKLSKDEIRIMELREEIKLLGKDIGSTRDGLDGAKNELKAIKEKGDVGDAIKENVLNRRVSKYSAEVKTLLEDLKRKQEELDKLIGGKNNKGAVASKEKTEDLLRKFQASEKRKELLEKRKQRVKNAALKATAAKVQTEQVRNDREDRLDRIAKAQEDELRDEIKAAKEARKKKRKEFLKQQERIEAELNALADKEALEEGLEREVQGRKEDLERIQSKLLKKLNKIDQKEKDDKEFEALVFEELNEKKETDEKRRREQRYLEKKKIENQEKAKIVKNKKKNTDDEVYFNAEAQKRKTYTDSIRKINAVSLDEWTRLSLDAREKKENKKKDKKKDELAKELRRRELKDQRKVDALKRKELDAANIELAVELKRKAALDRKINAAKRTVEALAIRKEAKALLEAKLSGQRNFEERLRDSLKFEAQKLAERLVPIKAGIETIERSKIDLEGDVLDLKSKELPILQQYLITNQKAKSLKYQSEQLTHIDKIEIRAKGTKVEKEALEIKLKVKQNYLLRLDKERQLNIYRQKLAVLQKRLENLDTTKVDDKEVNKVLLIQYGQIEKAMASVKIEMEGISSEIITKENAYNADIQLAQNERIKFGEEENKKNGSKLKATELAVEIEKLKALYKNSNTGSKQADILKEIEAFQRQLPEGIHEEILYENNRTIKKYIVSKDGNVDIFKMVMYSWGTTYYFKNKVAITKMRFDIETKY